MFKVKKNIQNKKLATYLDKIMMPTEKSSGWRARLSTPNSLQVALASQLPANTPGGGGHGNPDSLQV